MAADRGAARWGASGGGPRGIRPNRRPPAPGQTLTRVVQATTALPRLSAWKFHAQGVDLGTTWRQTAYVDGSWPAGPGILGYGDPFIVTTIPYGPNAGNKYPTTYFRTTFTVAAAPASITSLTLNVNYDDGFAAYLNGQEIARRGLAAGAGYAAYAANHEGRVRDHRRGRFHRGAGVRHERAGRRGAPDDGLQQRPGLRRRVDLRHRHHGQRARGPYLIGTSTGVTVRWRTNLSTDSRVRFGAAPGALTGTFDLVTPTTEHEVTLTGLTPETRYYYSVGSTAEVQAGVDAGTFFQTAPPVGAPRPTRFWILGDSGLPGTIQNGVRDAWEAYAAGAAADVWLMLGDNAYNAGTDAEFTAGLFNPYAAQLRKTILWLTRATTMSSTAAPGTTTTTFSRCPPPARRGLAPARRPTTPSTTATSIASVSTPRTSRAVNGAMLNWLRLTWPPTTRPGRSRSGTTRPTRRARTTPTTISTAVGG